MAGVRMDDPNGQGVGFGSKRNAQSVGFSYSDIPTSSSRSAGPGGSKAASVRTRPLGVSRQPKRAKVPHS
jgi:hypothetical protein